MVPAIKSSWRHTFQAKRSTVAKKRMNLVFSGVVRKQVWLGFREPGSVTEDESTEAAGSFVPSVMRRFIGFKCGWM